MFELLLSVKRNSILRIEENKKKNIYAVIEKVLW